MAKKATPAPKTPHKPAAAPTPVAPAKRKKKSTMSATQVAECARLLGTHSSRHQAVWSVKFLAERYNVSQPLIYQHFPGGARAAIKARAIREDGKRVIKAAA